MAVFVVDLVVGLAASVRRLEKLALLPGGGDLLRSHSVAQTQQTLPVVLSPADLFSPLSRRRGPDFKQAGL